jgi:hypothetical protein
VQEYDVDGAMYFGASTFEQLTVVRQTLASGEQTRAVRVYAIHKPSSILYRGVFTTIGTEENPEEYPPVQGHGTEFYNCTRQKPLYKNAAVSCGAASRRRIHATYPLASA